jgi:hypothetical protein
MRQQSTGTCGFCGGAFAKAVMTRHLQSCAQRKASSAPGGSASKTAKAFHVVVEGRYLPGYWMHLEAPGTATLEDLDHLLRDTWLECCGHLSQFEIQGQRYISYVPEDPWDEGGRSMRVALGKILGPGMKSNYEYDFGSTTALTLKVVSEQAVGKAGKSIHILARNNPPKITCDVCGGEAVAVCSDCQYSEGGWLCKKCAKKHKCGDEMLLPVVNSPRVGVCGYTG